MFTRIQTIDIAALYSVTGGLKRGEAEYTTGDENAMTSAGTGAPEPKDWTCKNPGKMFDFMNCFPTGHPPGNNPNRTKIPKRWLRPA